MQITPIPCLTDNYAYIINDKNSGTVGVVDPSEAKPIISFLSKNEQNIFKATINNRDILLKVLPELKKNNPDCSFIGRYLIKHHEILRDELGVSTKKIENMLDAALTAGALGGKITGSGGGGCMFAYAPNNPEIVAEAIEKAGGKSFIINSDIGTSVLQNT